MLKGIDISTFQNVVDFAALKQSGLVSFVFAKATEGLHTTDDQYKRNRDVAQNRGIPVGAYHFFHPSEDPIAQAEHFLAFSRPWGGLLPMVDVEVAEGCDAPQITHALAQFVRRVDAKLPIGKRMLIYTGWSFWNDAVGGSDAFSGHPLWVAAYPNHYDDSQSAPVPNGWKHATIWQYSSTGRLPGITGDVDLDRLEVPLSAITI